MIRISVGIEDAGDLWREFRSRLAALSRGVGTLPQEVFPRNELVDSAVKRQDIQFALQVFAEGRDIELGSLLQVDQLAAREKLSLFISQPPDSSALEISVNVDTLQRGIQLAAIDMSTGDAQTTVRAVGGRGVGILDDRRLDLGGCIGPLQRGVGMDEMIPLMLQP